MKHRRFAAVAGAAMLLLAACSGGSSGTAAPSLITELGEHEDSLKVLAWPGYVEDGTTDPAVDWVSLLHALPEPEGLAANLYGDDKPFAAMWSQGVPQASLRAMKAWCDERKVPLMLVLWPFLQGLGPGRTYPFQKLHDEVAADCAQAGIPFLDVRPALQATRHEELWVSPGDMHANPTAHQLAAPAIARFVRAHWPL